MTRIQRSWLALMIGNSRLHWAWFLDSTLRQTWDMPHLTAAAIAALLTPNPSPAAIPAAARDLLLPFSLQPQLPLWIASVVPAQTELWQPYGQTRVLTLDQVPIKRLYPTLGIDRALALWGAALTLGAPALVIDAGTALTVTGLDGQQQLVGGAIVPGLQTQLRSLVQNTAALPTVTPQPGILPQRWALNTPDAIRSGALYGLLALIRDYSEAWLAEFSGGAIALTGGDSALLFEHLETQFPALAAHMTVDPHLVFWGMQNLV